MKQRVRPTVLPALTCRHVPILAADKTLPVSPSIISLPTIPSSVPAAGVYTVSLRVSTTAPAQAGVGHSGVIFGLIDIPNTGGVWQTIKDTMTLPALTYTGIHVKAGSFKFNWFSIDDCILITEGGAAGKTAQAAATSDELQYKHQNGGIPQSYRRAICNGPV